MLLRQHTAIKSRPPASARRMSELATCRLKTDAYLLSSGGFSVQYGLGRSVVSRHHGSSERSVAAPVLQFEIKVGVWQQQGDDHWVLVFYGKVNWRLPLCILEKNRKSEHTIKSCLGHENWTYYQFFWKHSFDFDKGPKPRTRSPNWIHLIFWISAYSFKILVEGQVQGQGWFLIRFPLKLTENDDVGETVIWGL